MRKALFHISTFLPLIGLLTFIYFYFFHGPKEPVVVEAIAKWQAGSPVTALAPLGEEQLLLATKQQQATGPSLKFFDKKQGALLAEHVICRQCNAFITEIKASRDQKFIFISSVGAIENKFWVLKQAKGGLVEVLNQVVSSPVHSVHFSSDSQWLFVFDKKKLYPVSLGASGARLVETYQVEDRCDTEIVAAFSRGTSVSLLTQMAGGGGCSDGFWVQPLTVREGRVANAQKPVQLQVDIKSPQKSDRPFLFSLKDRWLVAVNSGPPGTILLVDMPAPGIKDRYTLAESYDLVNSLTASESEGGGGGHIAIATGQFNQGYPLVSPGNIYLLRHNGDDLSLVFKVAIGVKVDTVNLGPGGNYLYAADHSGQVYVFKNPDVAGKIDS